MKKTIMAYEIDSRGIRKQEHPTAFNTIFLDIKLASPDTSEYEVRKVIGLSEEKYCPVWAMMKGNVEIKIDVSVNSRS